MSKAVWMFSSNDKGFGPFTQGQLKQLIVSGILVNSDRVWKIDDSESRTVASLTQRPTLSKQIPREIPSRKFGVWVACAVLCLIVTCIGLIAGTGVLLPKLPEISQESSVIESTIESSNRGNGEELAHSKERDESTRRNKSEEDSSEHVPSSDDNATAKTVVPAVEKAKANLNTMSEAGSEPVVSSNTRRPDVLEGHTSYVSQLDISPNGKLAVTGSDDKTVIVWDVETGEKVKRWAGFTTKLFGVKFDPDGRSVWMCDRTTVSKCDIESGRILNKFEITRVNGFNQHAIAFNDDCTTLVTKNQGAAFVYDLSNGKKKREINDWINSLAFSNDGSSVFCGGSENAGEIKLRNTSTGNIETRFQGLNDRTISICESFDGKYVAAAGGPSKGSSLESGDRLPENNLVIWDSSGRVVQKLHVKEGWQWGLTFTPDNRYLIMGGSGKAEIGNEDWFGHQEQTDKGIRFWNIASGRLVKILRGHDAAVLNLAVTPDGKTLISTGADSKVRIWDLDKELAGEGN